MALVWWRGTKQKSLAHTLQVAQNASIHQATGVFKTTPILPLHNLVRILPIQLMLDRLCGTYAEQVARLPAPSIPVTLLLCNPVAIWPAFFSAPTVLTSLPVVYGPMRPFVLPNPPSLPLWVHPQCRVMSVDSLSKEYFSSVCRLIHSSPSPLQFSLYIYNLNIPHPNNHFSAGFLLVRRGEVVQSGWRSDADQLLSVFLALEAGLWYNFFGSVGIFLSQGSLLDHLFNLRAHKCLWLSRTITDLLTLFLDRDPAHSMGIYRFKKSWSGLPGSRTLDDLRTQVQDHLLLLPPHPTFRDIAWAAFCHLIIDSAQQPCSHPSWHVGSPPSSPTLPNFVRGFLSTGNCLYSSTCFRIAAGHAFCSEYSEVFRTNANDELCCLCSRPCCPTYHTIHHVIFNCPRHCVTRRCIIGDNAMPFLLTTYVGGAKLVRFLHYTQDLLWPLPPRPDPP